MTEINSYREGKPTCFKEDQIMNTQKQNHLKDKDGSIRTDYTDYSVTEHIFVPQTEDKDFCYICNKNFRNTIHKRIPDNERI